jgi:hypothetical protein
MNDFAKLQSSSPATRLDSHITVISANCRTFDHRVKLEIHQRKLTHEFLNEEKKLKGTQKWNHRVERNKVMKEIYQNTQSTEHLTPSVDEWLKMNKNEKRRNSVIVKRNQVF